MIKVGIVGASGYTGVELIRILSLHPEVDIVGITSNNHEGREYSDLYPSLKGYINLRFDELCEAEIIRKSDVIFSALPNGHAYGLANEVVAKNKKLIDLSADFRFNDFSVYEKWYGPVPLIDQKVKRIYGLPEIHRMEMKDVNVVANPGCYPTSVILGLAPGLRYGLIKTEGIIIDSKSGVSGAGHKPSFANLYAECNESVKAYGVACHRHTPEIEQELSYLSESNIKVTFTPHLVPMTRGILSTIYCELRDGITLYIVREAFEEFYSNESFVKILDDGQFPRTKDTYGSNNCHIGLAYDEHTGKLIIVSAIDNLVKGASGQAVQNMNNLFGLPEDTGLNLPAIYP
ncbi:N-acetyl-gamma-glutamyl-phosphate reductase [Calorimonas adulescens]|jgi:N-acetyl-gamma-glutamyl-phosphate reductase (EC 1.2.1.38)|uniref:N-acetyl-gamma-glutamyl-phosphate reductase n=1 Tax=Calorimonas adulescens TaxID=2606906 RepID=A0A5D8QGE6_9THEO|nr:N-acetyl-gamma-glutamyl-phosphate reductase [Calorimonas adulescens]TZE83625.1 N-acetyl-gamma-glutamyl-phosphate reductase [Calorimonas adulescens]